jgi:hypothetical protein
MTLDILGVGYHTSFGYSEALRSVLRLCRCVTARQDDAPQTFSGNKLLKAGNSQVFSILCPTRFTFRTRKVVGTAMVMEKSLIPHFCTDVIRNQSII